MVQLAPWSTLTVHSTTCSMVAPCSSCVSLTGVTPKHACMAWSGRHHRMLDCWSMLVRYIDLTCCNNTMHYSHLLHGQVCNNYAHASG